MPTTDKTKCVGDYSVVISASSSCITQAEILGARKSQKVSTSHLLPRCDNQNAAEHCRTWFEGTSFRGLSSTTSHQNRKRPVSFYLPRSPDSSVYMAAREAKMSAGWTTACLEMVDWNIQTSVSPWHQMSGQGIQNWDLRHYYVLQVLPRQGAWALRKVTFTAKEQKTPTFPYWNTFQRHCWSLSWSQLEVHQMWSAPNTLHNNLDYSPEVQRFPSPGMQHLKTGNWFSDFFQEQRTPHHQLQQIS